MESPEGRWSLGLAGSALFRNGNLPQESGPEDICKPPPILYLIRNK